MTDLAVTFDPKITIENNKLTLTGTASGTNLNKVEMFDHSGKDLGSAQLANGAWTFTKDLGTVFSFNEFTAGAIDVAGNAVKTEGNLTLFGGITGEPFNYIESDTINGQDGTVKFYSDKGSILYHGDFSIDANNNNTVVETGDSLKTQFVFVNSPGTFQTITNFHVAGPSHDTLVLPGADFANMTELLRNTTMSDGSAVIHDPNSTASLTLAGVTTSQMKSHPHDFSFHGNGQLLPATA